MTSQEWLADYLEHGRPAAREPGSDVPDVASAHAARRLRALLAEPDSWAEPPAGLLEAILADATASGPRRPAPRARPPFPGARQAGTAAAGPGCAGRSGQARPHCWPPPRS
jgi:hypothetical protein